MMMPTIRHMRIFMSFHHICFRTRFAPLRKPWADTARLSVLSCSESRRAPRSETLLMLSRMIPTVLSISCSRPISGTKLSEKHIYRNRRKSPNCLGFAIAEQMFSIIAYVAAAMRSARGQNNQKPPETPIRDIQGEKNSALE
jgi:hypothetical protein